MLHSCAVIIYVTALLANSPAHQTQPQRTLPVRGAAAEARKEVSQAEALAPIAGSRVLAAENVTFAATGANDSYGVQEKPGLAVILATLKIPVAAPTIPGTASGALSCASSHATRPLRKTLARPSQHPPPP
ncbi:hypothetical protein BD626DRAFT_494194 [Schizophyllum amplum]|uniref:Uncharacterized protein n=1 Tax=Schizophyllum amplum TaxID=97359 RepID=A0A550CF16_9AGAR|nr:hypothetical protein BD626DRAFT_494194 [Auriculariopsis ampla]